LIFSGIPSITDSNQSRQTRTNQICLLPDSDWSFSRKQGREQKKTGKYQPNEDLGLCVLWIRITSNPIVGTDQDGGTFWKRVAIFYKDEVPGSSQSLGSLKARWGVLQRTISKFRACVNQLEHFNQRGALTEEKLKGALQLFSEDQKCTLKHLACYNCLIKEAKWCTYIDENSKKSHKVVKKKQARSPSSEVPLSSTAALEFVSKNESTNNLERLIGRKKAKMINSLNTKNDNWKEKIAVAHHKFANKTACQNNIFELEAEALRMIANNGATNSQVKIMNQDLTNLDEDLKEFFKLKKKEILNNLCKQASSSTQ
jgi:hypothetical protein